MVRVFSVVRGLEAALVMARNAFRKVAPQQILAMAMIAVALAVVDKPNVGSARIITEQLHISPLVFAVVTVLCGATILALPKSAAFMALTLPLVMFIVATVVNYATSSNAPYTPIILYVALYLTVLRMAVGKEE